MSDKPLVFNYREYDTLRDKCNDMAVEIEALQAKVRHQAERVNALLEENTNLRLDVDNYKSKYETACLIINTNHEMIQTYTEIFKMQEAELQKLRKEALDV
jgi:regulator of replication initiation timing